MTAISPTSRRPPNQLSDLAVRSFVSLAPATNPEAAKAQLLTSDDHSPPPLQKVGTLGLVNQNAQEVAVGALDKWLAANNRAAMFAQHNLTTVPAGSWRDFDLVNGTDLWARPYVTVETTIGRDVLASIEAGDIRGISWTVYPASIDSYEYRPAVGKEPGDWLGEVLVITEGILVEASVVSWPADKTARFRSRKLGSTTGKAVARKLQRQATELRSLKRGQHG